MTNELFIKPLEFEKVSYKRVSENPAEWTGNIMEAFYSEFPFFANSQVSVNLTQKDEQKGYAIGAIKIEEGTGLVVPIVIQNRELFPFDVCIHMGKTLPLTNTTLNLYIQSRSAFQRAVKPDAGDPTTALFNSSFSQVITPTFVTDQFKTASIKTEQELLDKIASTNDVSQKYFLANQYVYNRASYNGMSWGWKPSSNADPKHFERFVKEPDANKKVKILAEKFDTAWLGEKPHEYFIRHGAGFDEKTLKQYRNNTKTASMKEDMAINSLKYDLIQEQVSKQKQNLEAKGTAIGAITSPVVGMHPTVGATTGRVIGNLSTAANPKLVEDRVLDKMQKDALVGGQGRADQLFVETLEKVKQGSKSGQYLALQFRRWALEQGFTVSHWDIPGFEKIAEEQINNWKTVNDVHQFLKNGSLIDTIAPTITEEMKSKFIDEFSKNASIAEGFKQNGTESVIEKIAKLQPGKVNFEDKVRKELDRDIHFIYKNAGAYQMILGNSIVNDPIEFTVPADTVEKFDMIKTSASYMEKTASNLQNTVATVDTGSEVIAILDNGDFTNVDSFGFTKIACVGNLSQLNIEPQLIKNALWNVENYPHQVFEVTRIWNDNGRERIETFNGLEKKAYCRIQGIDTPHTENNITYLPINTKLIKLGNRVPISVHNLQLHNNEIQCIDENQFVLRGNELTEHLKTAGAIQNKTTTLWTVLQCGGTKEDLEKISSLKSGEKYNIQHDMHVPIPFEKVAVKLADEYNTHVRRIKNIAKNFIKEASVLTDVPTVDAVLSLNFVNRDNIIEFAKALPLFEEVSEKLSDMLLKTRLGVRIVDESVLRRVMLGVVDIVEVLAGISNLASKK